MTDQSYTVDEFVSTFKVGRTTTFAEIGSGRLATYKVGRRRYISARAACEWQQRLETETIHKPKSQGATA